MRFTILEEIKSTLSKCCYQPGDVHGLKKIDFIITPKEQCLAKEGYEA